MIDFLLSTGIRVGELVRLNIDDIDFLERECVVYGKGDKERKAYFDAKTKLHLMNYIESRTDNNSALFVSLNKPHNRLTESGVELRLREMGKKLGKRYTHISLEELWQPEQLRRACLLNKCRRYLGMSKLIQLSDMLW